MFPANTVPAFAAHKQLRWTIVTAPLRTVCGLCLLAATAAAVGCVLLVAAALSASGAFRS